MTWFEEPVSSDDQAGLRQVRDSCPIDIAAGEYGYSPCYYAPMIAAGAVDCVQADITRCGGVTGWLAVAHVAAARQLDISGHSPPRCTRPRHDVQGLHRRALPHRLTR
ncbi:MAG TPA: enolase C-terminal domain-like protein [Acidimicrobiales bacterium]